MLSSILKAISLGIVAAVAGIVAAILGIAAIFFFAIFGALVGALTGWLVQLTPWLGAIVQQGFVSIGIVHPDLVALGAAMGFVAGFFKSSYYEQKSG